MKKTNVAGHSLLTLLVYSALLSGVAVAIMPYTIHVLTAIKNHQETTRLCIQRAIALDSLAYDIQTASGLCDDWQMIPSSQLIMRCHEHYIGWVIEQKNLVRIEGVYDATYKKWHAHTKSFITTGIDQLQITLHKDSTQPTYVSAVTIQVADERSAYHATRYIVLPNRVLL